MLIHLLEGFSTSQWEPAALALEELTLSVGGLVRFANNDIRTAVRRRFLANQVDFFVFSRCLYLLRRFFIVGLAERFASVAFAFGRLF